LSSLRKSRQCLLRIRFTGKRHAAELLESNHFSLALLQQLLVDWALRLGVAVLRVDEHPALGDPHSRAKRDSDSAVSGADR